jgi:peptidoglycan/xylan/chitin deacetylase (PgdA/CDA1 family)
MKLASRLPFAYLAATAFAAVACSAHDQETGSSCEVGGLNQCGVCWPALSDLGTACVASNGCAGTKVCSADGKTSTCETSSVANACGVCGGALVSGVNIPCTSTAGDTGFSVCNDAGDGTVCAKTVVTMTFDDTFSDTLLAAPLLEAHGFRATFFVNSPRFGRNAQYMTLAQVLDLQSRGHEIGGHTLDHPHLPTLSVNAQKIEICNDRAVLLSDGLDVRHFAYPFGEANADTEAAAQFCNYLSARGVGNLSDSDGTSIHAENYVPPDVFKIRADSSITSSQTLADMQARVLAGEAAGRWVIINMHHVCDTCATTEVGVEILTGFLDWLEPHIAGTTTYVRKIRQMIAGDSRPPVLVSGSLILVDAGDMATESFSPSRAIASDPDWNE